MTISSHPQANVYININPMSQFGPLEQFICFPLVSVKYVLYYQVNHQPYNYKIIPFSDHYGT